MANGPKKRKAQGRTKAAPKDENVDGGPDPAEAARRVAAWVDDCKQQERFLGSRGGGLEGHLLDAAGGMLLLRDFMPTDVADSVLTVLEGLPEEVWELSEQATDSAAANHRFWSADLCDVPALACLRGVFWKLLPCFHGEPTLPIFSCGRYAKSDFIGRHDDRAHVPFNNDGNIFSRTVAAIWYLTRNWSPKDGGCLLDLQAEDEGKPEVRHMPQYNSLMVFEVPHWHAVEEVSSDRYRYSIFGWWHQKGKRYELPGVPRSVGAGRAGARPKKKRKVARGGKVAHEDEQTAQGG